MRRRFRAIWWWLTRGNHEWVTIDPTGGDPFLGGPVRIQVCRRCGVERA